MLPTTPQRATHDYERNGTWMNRVERWFSALTTKKLQRSSHRSGQELAADIEAWAAAWNDDPKPFVWTKTADQILERLANCCAQINGTEYISASAWLAGIAAASTSLASPPNMARDGASASRPTKAEDRDCCRFDCRLL